MLPLCCVTAASSSPKLKDGLTNQRKDAELPDEKLAAKSRKSNITLDVINGQR